MSTPLHVSASAPGKVLICGGYLVVEEGNIGLSLSVDARFETRVLTYECIDRAAAAATATQSSAVEGTVVFIQSPQFGVGYEFLATFDAAAGTVAVRQRTGSPSPFLQMAIAMTFANVAGSHGDPAAHGVARVDLQLLASNDFYSQRGYLSTIGKEVTAETLRTVPPHNAIVGDVSKTGLGSSAALTVSLVACLHRFLAAAMNIAPFAPCLQRERQHRVAQAAHCVAQGKVGSGFDVYTATYGTCVYSRFPPKVLDGLMSLAPDPAKGKELQTVALRCADLAAAVDEAKEWVPRAVGARRTLGLPRGLHLMLADIAAGGSATPLMTSRVMAMRKAIPADQLPTSLWTQIARGNEAYVALLEDLSLRSGAQSMAVGYDAVMTQCAQSRAADWTNEAGDATKSLLIALRNLAAAQRIRMRDMGQAAAVEIEPPLLTPLLDATSALPGVLAVGCPGAGGYDAIYALIVAPPGDEAIAASRKRIEAAWEAHNSGGRLAVCPLLVREECTGIH